MAIDKEFVEKRIEEETAKVKVDSYQKTVSLGGWAGSGRTMWAISTMGALTGAALGLVAPLFPVLVGASTLAMAATAILPSMAIFAGTGIAIGYGAGLMTGRMSGSVSAAAEEQERRLKKWTVEQILKENPHAQIEHESPKPQVKKTFWQNARDKYYRYINPSVGLTMAAIGVTGGLIMAAAFLSSGGAAGVLIAGASGLSTLTGIPASTFALSTAGTFGATATTAIIAYSAGICGFLGGLFGIHYPRVTSEFTEFYGNLLNGKYALRKWETPEAAAQAAKANTPSEVIKDIPKSQDEALAAQIMASVEKPHVTMRRFDSFQEMVIKGKNAAIEAGEMLIKR